MIQVIVTARRDRGKLTTVSRSVESLFYASATTAKVTSQAGGASWEPLCDVIISRLVREGVLPDPNKAVSIT